MPAVNLAETVVVVSGLPRSGTSMVMQMLAAGGLPILSDGRRATDEDNPLGYFEYEPVMHQYANADWIRPRRRGRRDQWERAVMRYSPGTEDYGIIFMSSRRFDEVLGLAMADAGRRRWGASRRPTRWSGGLA